jgi:hypothetical protein
MLKIIRAGDSNVTVSHNGSYISLNGAASLNLATGDILVLINKGGDPDSSINGVWYEVCRSVGNVTWASAYTAVNMSVGQTTLDMTDQLKDVGVETVGLTADGAVNLTYITDGHAGMVKHLVALDDNVTLIQNSASAANGTFHLAAPAGADLAMQTNDAVTLINIGGDGATDGYWMEMSRRLTIV